MNRLRLVGMRVSIVARGIRGIFPLVRVLAPQAISPPFDLSALRGVRLAIDATLLVQRLHFADDPHPARHVIGFYRLITSLRQYGVLPLMVFDHPQKRLAFKDREQLKRKHKRELDKIRSRLEHERRGRLQELQAHLDTLSALPEVERRRVGELLDQWRSQASVAAEGSLPTTPPVPSPPLPREPTRSQMVAYSMHVNWMQLEESLRSAGTNQSKGQKLLAEAEQQVYQTITTQLVQGEAPPSPLFEPGIATPPRDPSPAQSFSTLNAMHNSLTKTYSRATSPLSASIYQDCATLSSLMAVPAFWTGDGTRTGGGRIHEAEAYAASLVRSGFADLVASEDSDVLLYEAPLLRGLMGGIRNPGALGARGKLQVICGTRVRIGLFPKSYLDKLLQLQSTTATVEEGDGEGGVESTYDRLTRSLMLDFALLCGTDFNRTIPGIGPKTALRLLNEHGSISAILRKEGKKFNPPDGLSLKEYEGELRNARSVFLNPPKVRAAARSILGTAAAEAAAKSVAQQGSTSIVERLLSAADAVSALPALADDARSSSDTEPAYCTAEATEATELDSTTGSTSPSPEAIQTTSTALPSYDRQAVHDFLRSHGLFRPSTLHYPDADADLAVEEFDTTHEEEWRDLLDLELGLTIDSPCLSDHDDIIQTDGQVGEGMGTATLGADFFGERKGVACWNPEMEQRLRAETTAPRHTESRH